MYQYTAELVRCKDGDTQVLDVDLGFGLRWTDKNGFRLVGVDTPELTTTAGHDAKTYVEEWFKSFAYSDGAVRMRITTHKQDKYGRWLYQIDEIFDASNNAWVRDIDLAQIIINAGHGVPYLGGKR